jgi:Tat protein translocase TatB subunit
MFEVGFSEILLIMGLALLVLGPEKLPGLAQKVGKWTGRARSMARQLRTQLEQEVTIEEMTKTHSATPAPPSQTASQMPHAQPYPDIVYEELPPHSHGPDYKPEPENLDAGMPVDPPTPIATAAADSDTQNKRDPVQ